MEAEATSVLSRARMPNDELLLFCRSRRKSSLKLLVVPVGGTELISGNFATSQQTKNNASCQEERPRFNSRHYHNYQNNQSAYSQAIDGSIRSSSSSSKSNACKIVLTSGSTTKDNIMKVDQCSQQKICQRFSNTTQIRRRFRSRGSRTLESNCQMDDQRCWSRLFCRRHWPVVPEKATTKTITTNAASGSLMRPYRNILLLLMMVSISLSFAAHTLALGDDGQLDAASRHQQLAGQQRTTQQVHARLIPLPQQAFSIADNGKPDEQRQQEREQENVSWNIQNSNEQHLESGSAGQRFKGGGAKITKRFAATPSSSSSSSAAAAAAASVALSSAEMPAEFRGGDLEEAAAVAPIDQPREQSRLAKLCQQTSSVLASVLPAPFGGHKRSILCQFFGQVHVSGGGGKRNAAPVTNGGYPITGLPAVVLPQVGRQFAGAQLVATNPGEPDSISILHQHQQAPVAMLATGNKHPIQLVLEHQQRQAALAAASLHQGTTNNNHNHNNLPIPMSVINNHQHLIQPNQAGQLRPQQQQLQQQQLQQQLYANKPASVDLNGSLNDGAIPVAMHKQQNPSHTHHRPSVPSKFSAPLVTSPAASTQTSGQNSNAWRIFNVTLFAVSPMTSGQALQGSSSTTPMPDQHHQQASGGSVEGSSGAPPASAGSHDSLGASSGADGQSPKTASGAEALMTASKQASIDGSDPVNSKQAPRVGKRTSETPQHHRSPPAPSPAPLPVDAGGAAAADNKHTDLPVAESRQSPRAESAVGDVSQDGVRTIEVIAQSAPPASVGLGNSNAQTGFNGTSNQTASTTPATITSKEQKQSSSSQQSSRSDMVQKREELVIASINNLTRIAFGNQLRDTMKVINKLIDSQAELFNESSQASMHLNRQHQDQAANLVDPMQVSESKGRVVVASSATGLKMIPMKHFDKTKHDHRQATTNNKTTRKLELSAGSGGGGAKMTVEESNSLMETGKQRKQQTQDRRNHRDKLDTTTATTASSQLKQSAQTADGGPEKKTKTQGTRTTQTADRAAKSQPEGRKPTLDSVIKGTTTKVAADKVAADQTKQTKAKGQTVSGSRSSQHRPTKGAAHSSASSLELRRLTTIGRSLLEQSYGQTRTESTRRPVSSSSTTTPGKSSSRSQQFHSTRTSGGASSYYDGPMGDLMPAQSIRDLRRGDPKSGSGGSSVSPSSVWVPSGGGSAAARPTSGDKSSSPVMRKLRDEFSRSPTKSTTIPLTTRSSISSIGSSSSLSQSSVSSSATVTQFPWLLPDKSASAEADLFDRSMMAAASSSQIAQIEPRFSSSSAFSSSEAPSKKWTTRSTITPSYATGDDKLSSSSLSSLPPVFASAKANNLDANLNSLEQKQDSLTTLKMAVMRAKLDQGETGRAWSLDQGQQQQAATTTTARSTPLPFSSGSSTQSRWIPSTMFITRQQTSTTTTSTTQAPQTSIKPSTSSSSSPTMTMTTVMTTAMRSSGSGGSTPSEPSPRSSSQTTPLTTTTTRSLPTSTGELMASSYSQGSSRRPVAASTTISLNDLNEARASESISKFTTHLNEATGEQLAMATTKRHLAHPLPQIANTGDYFSAETIASWPEKYQTMISRAMELEGESSNGGKQQQASMMTTSAFETTRRNGESYHTFGGGAGVTKMTTTPAQTTLARHRLDAAESTAQAGGSSRPPAVVLSNTPGITILPSNHKLGSFILHESSIQDASDSAAATVPMMTQTTLASGSGSSDGVTEPPTRSYAAAGSVMTTTQTKQLPPYTLIDQLLGYSSSSSPQPSSRDPANQTATTSASDSTTTTNTSNDTNTTKYFTLANLGAGDASSWPHQANGTNSSSTPSDYLRPPYQDNYGQFSSNDFLGQLSDPMLVLDQAQSRPHVSRKLYELLVPSTQNFVGSQNPLNRQRFNWSALKYLAQNILSSGRYSTSGGADGNSTRNFNSSEPALDDEIANATNTTTQNQQFSLDQNQNRYAPADNRTKHERLNDLIAGLAGKASYAPTNYYELTASNESALMWPPSYLIQQQQEQQDELMAAASQNQQLANNSTSSGSKGLLERASNLLSEMKQIEQKRAAAILAAFRYQVPGPLVRPWDVASDLHGGGGGGPSGRDPIAPGHSSISRFFADRFDGLEHGTYNHNNKHLTTGQLLNTMKSALFKQKLVARDELEARLNRHNLQDRSSLASSSSSSSSDSSSRRRDDFLEDSIELSAGASGNTTTATRDTNNSTVRLEDLEYMLAAHNETVDAGQQQQQQNATNGRISNGTSRPLTMLDKLLLATTGGGLGGAVSAGVVSNLSSSSARASLNSSEQALKDFDLIDLSEKPVDELIKREAQQPRYMRLLDHDQQTAAFDRKPSLEDGAGKAKRLFARAGTRQQVADVIARARLSAATSGEPDGPRQEGLLAAPGTVPTGIDLEHNSHKVKTRTDDGRVHHIDSKPLLSPEDEFNCDGRSAGFYPDVGSSCRTFYHCSNTGHLLTFNCPSSTRFDEKSLKCGPWYEVPCDIGRVRTRRY